MKPDEVLCCMFFAFVVFTVHKHNWAYNTAHKQNRTCPGNLYQYSNMAPRLSGQNYKCLKFFFFLSLNSQKRLGHKENTTIYRSLS